MGFVKRLNSRDLVNDPCNGAEVYPITATSAVYREGSEQSLETILSALENAVNRKVVSNVTQDFAHNKIHIDYTDNTSADIIYDRLGDFSVSSNTSGDTKTFTISFKKPDNTTVSQTLEVPIVTAEEKQTWNNKSDFTGYTSDNKLSASYISGLATVATSGNYSDLINPPDITTSVSYSSKSYNLAGYITGISSGSVTYRKWGRLVSASIEIHLSGSATSAQKKYINIGTSLFAFNATPVTDYYGMAFSYLGSDLSQIPTWDGNMMPFKVKRGANPSSDRCIEIMNNAENLDIYGSIVYMADTLTLL